MPGHSGDLIQMKVIHNAYAWFIADADIFMQSCITLLGTINYFLFILLNIHLIDKS
jgi:hypothetical protein